MGDNINFSDRTFELVHSADYALRTFCLALQSDNYPESISTRLHQHASEVYSPSLQLHRFRAVEPYEVSSQIQCKDCHRSLQGTIYGYGQNSKGACAFGQNFADTTGLPWSTPPAGASDGGTGLPTTFIALNNPQFDGSASCGTCVWFRGTGE